MGNEMRPVIRKEFPNIKFVEMGRVLGERWRALTPIDKKKFELIAAEDKVRFQHEMQQYTATQQAQQEQNAALQAQQLQQQQQQIQQQQQQQAQQQQQQQQAQQQAQQQQQQQQQENAPVSYQHYLPPAAPSNVDTTVAPQHNQYGLDPQQYQHYDTYGQTQIHQ